jgi:hypothetical protein
MHEQIREPVGPVDGRKVPRFAGAGSIARLLEIDRIPDYHVAVLGVPFDNGTYDHAELTAIAAATVIFDIAALLGKKS